MNAEKEHEDKEFFDKYKDLLQGQEPGECQACGGPLFLEKVNLEDYQEGKLYIMDKVPAYVCQSCGEVWVPEPIMKEFEKMIEVAKHRKKAKEGKKKK
jgi:YgiT-type zinc finger domain-containing protein